MGPPVLHLLACLALAGAAYFWKRRHAEGAGGHRFLLPFALVAAGLGWLLVYRLCAEWFAASYGGVEYTPGPPTAADWTRAAAGAVLAVLPTAVLFPAVSRRPRLVIALALLASVAGCCIR